MMVLLLAILMAIVWGGFVLDSHLVTRPPNKHDLWVKPTEEEENKLLWGDVRTEWSDES